MTARSSTTMTSFSTSTITSTSTSTSTSTASTNTDQTLMHSPTQLSHSDRISSITNADYFSSMDPAAIEQTLLDMDETIKGLEDYLCALRAEPLVLPLPLVATPITTKPHSQSHPSSPQPYTHQTFAHGHFGPLPTKPSKSHKSKSKSMREHAHALSLPIPSLSAHGLHLKSSGSGSRTSMEKEKKEKRGRLLEAVGGESGSGSGSRSQSKHKKVINMFTKRPSLSRASQSEIHVSHSSTSPPHKVASFPSLAAAAHPAEPEREKEELASWSYLSEAILQLRHQHAHLLHLIPAPTTAQRKTSAESLPSPLRALPPTPPPDEDENEDEFDADLEAITASALQQASSEIYEYPTRPPLALVASKGHLSRASIASTNVSVSVWHDAESRPSSPVAGDTAVQALEAVVERPSATEDDEEERVVLNTPPMTAKPMTGLGVPAVNPGIVKRRMRLEVAAPPAPGLKAAVKAISNATAAGSMPLLFNEPFGVLQRMAEEMEYTELIATAIKTTDPIARLCYVAAFAMSSYAGTAHRGTRKPCNPLLGETFELDRPDLGFRFIAEKVSHVPMQTASHAEGDGWVMKGLTQVRQGRKKASYEIAPLGWQYLELSEWGETYRWDKPPTYVSLNPFGSSSPCICGTMTITNVARGEEVELEFKEAGRALEGVLRDADGEARAWIRGTWDSELFVRIGSSTASEQLIWQAHPFSPNPENFGLSPFALTLNELSEDLYDAQGNLLIAPTDTRLRPDQRLYEQGRIDEAEALKHELETQQRRRNTEKRQVDPRWFRVVEGEGQAGTDEWRFSGGYWEARMEEIWDGASRGLW